MKYLTDALDIKMNFKTLLDFKTIQLSWKTNNL